MRIVIVGNGVAGMEAALGVRARHPDWPITIVSEESDHFIARTSLMYVFSGQLRHADIEPLERDAYERHRFVRVRARAIGIDVANKHLLLSGHAALPYDRLLVASGSRPRPAPWPGSDLRGIGAFVTLSDLAWLEREVHARPSFGGEPPRADLHQATTTPDSPYAARPVAAKDRGAVARRPTIVGGGLIGVEAAEILTVEKLRPRFVIRDEWFWPMALDANEARWIADHMTRHGVDVELMAEVVRFEGDARGNVARIETSLGTHETDLVVVAIGVVPNTDWASDALKRESKSGGIEVDDGLQASVSDVFAAGDCAAVGWWDGTRRPEQLWYTGRDQGRIAARRLCGEDAQYVRGTWYNSAKLFDVEYTTVGRVGSKLPGEKTFFYEERGRVRSTSRIIESEGRFVGANMLGRRWDHSVLVEWIEEERTARWVLEHLPEASFDTEFVPPFVTRTTDWQES